MNRLPRQQRRRKRRASRQRSDRPLRSALYARDLLQVKVRIFGNRRQKGILAGGYRRSQLAAFEVLRGLDRSIVQYADAHRRVICASSERDGRQPLDGLQDRSRRRGHAEIEPSLADRLCGGDQARSAGDLDIEPVLFPQTRRNRAGRSVAYLLLVVARGNGKGQRMPGGRNSQRAWPDDGVTRVPYFVYEDAELYQEEQERIFRGPVWNYLGLEIEIPEPGDYITNQVGDTPVIVVRAEDGAIKAVVNRCAHKGSMICYQPSGHVTALTCPYHNWIYDFDGKLKSVRSATACAARAG